MSVPRNLVLAFTDPKPHLVRQRTLRSRLRRWWYRHEDLFLLSGAVVVGLGLYLYLLSLGLEWLR